MSDIRPISNEDQDLIRELQEYCAVIAERKSIYHPTLLHGREDTETWNDWDVIEIARIFNRSENPSGLFRFVDERTGDWRVGYKTRDGRNWFHILRQMRNSSAILFDLIKWNAAA